MRGRPSLPLGQRRLAPQRDQLEIILLRPERAPPSSGEIRAQIVEQDRCRTHGEDARLRTRRPGQMRAIANSVDRRVGDAAQIRSDRHVAVGKVQPGPGQPLMGPRARRPDRQRRRNLAPVVQHHAIALHFGDLDTLDQGDTGRVQTGADQLSCPVGQDRQRLLAFDHRDPWRGFAQTPGHRQRQLHAGDATADHGRALARMRHESRPAVGETVQRLGRHPVLGKSGQIRHVRGDADVERGDVIGDLAPPGDADTPPLPVDRLGPPQDQPRPGVASQTNKVDLQIGACIMAGNSPGSIPV